MPQAKWKGKILAESATTVVVENNHYFPPDSLRREYLTTSNHTSVCPWKGTAHYFHVEVDGDTNENAAWYYPAPKQKAAHIKDHVAFWRGVEIIE